ncbi:MAG: helix-turn-helix domain-containing protein, partial [Shimia sp.]|nr:helix-turn-helix domain-containing protein [Shimia sp.]
MPSVAIVLTGDFSILSLTLVTEPLRVANRELMEQVWNWRVLSASGGPILSSSGFEIKTEELDDMPADIILLISAYAPESALTKPLLSWLRRRARSGALMGCVDTGAMIFAEAGLLTKTPAAVHFEALRGYREAYEDQMFVDRMFDLSDTLCSSAGGVATFDMTLALLERYSSRDLSLRVAEIMTYRPTEHAGPQQKMLVETSLMRMDRNLGRAVDLMLAHLSEPLSIAAISDQVGLEQWTLVRLFQRHLRQSPSEYYRFLRLSQARNLLVNSSYRISEVGALCG